VEGNSIEEVDFALNAWMGALKFLFISIL